MSSDKILELLMYAVPSIITGAVAYFMFESHFKDQRNTRKWLIHRENQKHALPLKLQAYERLALLLERITPTKLLIRVEPLNNDKVEYVNYLIRNIEQEYEHNLTQQIYITEEAWVMILTAKNTIIQNLRKTATDEELTTADEYRKKILSIQFDNESASSVALSYLKSEVSEILR